MPPKSKNIGKKKTFVTRKPTRKVTPVGTGQFAISPQADKRLEPRTTSPSSPAAPLPGLNEIVGDSVVTPQRLFYYKQTRFSPIRILTPELLGQYIDLYEQGYIRWFALMQWYIAQRDPILQTVMAKRYGSVKRLRWQILIEEDLEPGQAADAEKHKDALFKFYQNIRTSSAVDLNLNAGISSFFENMMSAVAYRWSVHEIIWNPMADGNISARMNFVPLWFFENRTGKLRFTETDYQLDGRDLRDGNFVVATGNGLMEPCSVSYLYKTLAQKWWLAYIEGHASPLKVGMTNAARGSVNWKSMERALQQAVDSILINKEEDVKRVDTAAAGELPYIPMVEEMNRMMATLWRGADLSTMSAKASNAGQGALLQGKEEYFLQCNDAALISEVCNLQLDPQVIGWHFGTGVRPLAYFKLVVPPNIEATSDISVFDALISWGLAEDIGRNQIREHFGIAKRNDDDEPIQPVAQKTPANDGNELKDYTDELESANEQHFIDLARRALERGDERLNPLWNGIRLIVESANELRPVAFAQFRRTLAPTLHHLSSNPDAAPELKKVLAQPWMAGLASCARKYKVFK